MVSDVASVRELSECRDDWLAVLRVAELMGSRGFWSLYDEVRDTYRQTMRAYVRKHYSRCEDGEGRALLDVDEYKNQPALFMGGMENG